MQALRSPASRSGISAKVCEASSPEATRSRTALTRMRIPRAQGRWPYGREWNLIGAFRRPRVYG